MSLHSSVRIALSLMAGLLLSATAVQAQERYYPLDHLAPTGMAGRWNALIRPGSAGLPQQIAVRLPLAGTVRFYTGGPTQQVALSSPAQVGVGVGYVYRFCISDIPGYPGVELYPTVEIIDRLNPPPGLEREYPIPIEFTEEEIEIAIQDRMVTKVVYLEHPDMALPVEQSGAIRNERLAPSENLLQAADKRGRPLAIIRLGGRIPDPRSPSDEFYSQSPIWLVEP